MYLMYLSISRKSH